MREIRVTTTRGILREKIYKIEELPLFDLMMRCDVSKRRGVNYLEIPAAFDIETTNITEPEQQYYDAGIREHLRALQLRYNDKIAADIPDFGSLRKQYFGKLKLSKNKGVPIDAAYQELSGLRPDLFPVDIISPSDQLLRIMDVIDKNMPQDDFRPFAYMYHWQFCIAGYVCFGRTWSDFKRLMHRLESEMNLSEKMRLVVYIHNANFEFTFAKHFINIIESFFRDANKPLKFCTTGGIEFRDSYALSNMNLKKFCENSGALHVKLSGDDFDYSQIRTPGTILTEEEEAYCFNDVAGLVECIRVRMKEHTLAGIPLTSTGYIRRIARNEMKKNPENRVMFKRTALSAELYLMFKDAFRGGDVHGNSLYADQTIEDMDGFDIASAYPASLYLDDNYPMGPFYKISARRFKLPEQRAKCSHILKLRIDQPRYIGKCGDPYISASKISAYHPAVEHAEEVQDNGRLRYYNGIIEMTILDVDYDIIRAEYSGAFYIADVYASVKGRLPEEFRALVIDLFRQKTEKKCSPDDAEQYYYYCRTKELINALYGMCAQKIDMQPTVYDSATHEFYEGRKNEDTGAYEPIPLQELLDKYYKSRNSFLPYQWAAFCTANVRAKLRRAMEQGAGRKTVYCDTDSCKFLHDENILKWFEEENARLIKIALDAGGFADDKKGKRHYLGSWEYDGHFDKFRHLGSKRYCVAEKRPRCKDCNGCDGVISTTIAGVNKARAAEFFTRAGIDRFTDGTVIHDSGHIVAYYNEDDPHFITVDGCTFLTASNVALVNDTYTLGMDSNYKKIVMDLKNNIYHTDQV